MTSAACSARTDSSTRSRGTIHVIRNDDVARPTGGMPAACSAREPARTVANVALIPAPMASQLDKFVAEEEGESGQQQSAAGGQASEMAGKLGGMMGGKP